MKKVHKRFAALFLAAVLLLTGMMPAAADQNTAQAPVTSESSKTQEAAGTGTDAEVSPSPSADPQTQDASQDADSFTSADDSSGLTSQDTAGTGSDTASESGTNLPDTDTQEEVSSPDPASAADAETETPENTLEAEFLYSELSEDETTRGVIVKLATDQPLEQAVLTWQDENGTSETEASHLVENYAAFFLPASDSITYLSVASVAAGSSFTTDLAPLEEGNTLDYQQLAQEEAAEEQGVSGEEMETALENVITVSPDEEITEEEVAAAVTDTASVMNVSPRSGNTTKVIVLDPGHGRAGSGTYRDWGDFVLDEAVINFKISQYTKEALEENYSNIEVYLTKTTQNENPSISARVDFAVEKGADILVSQHVNATSETVTSAHGVVAMVPRVDSDHPYHAETAQEAQELARDILDELVDLGFNDMGFQMPMSQTGDTYEDGSLADYYGIGKPTSRE